MAGPFSLRSISYVLVESIRVLTIYTKALEHIPDLHFISLIFHWSNNYISIIINPLSKLQTPHASGNVTAAARQCQPAHEVRTKICLFLVGTLKLATDLRHLQFYLG